MRAALFSVLVVGTAACGGDDEPEGAIDAAVGSIDAPATAMPLSPGAWGYASYDRTSDTCGGAVDGDGDFTIDQVTATSFRIVRAGSPSSTCTINASDFFDCTTPDEVQDRRPTFDAVFRARLTLAGHITTTTLASGMQSIGITCTGTQCAQAADGLPVPCMVSANIAISHR